MAFSGKTTQEKGKPKKDFSYFEPDWNEVLKTVSADNIVNAVTINTQSAMQQMKQDVENIRQLSLSFSFTSIASALGISRPYLYDIIRRPYKISQQLHSEITRLAQNPVLITPARTEKEKMQDEINSLKKYIASLEQQISDLKKESEKQMKEDKKTIQDLVSMLKQKS